MIELPWPPKELSPNARIHHMAKARAAKAYRESAYWITKAVGIPSPVLLDDRIILAFDFHPPDARRRDLDNMLSSVKAAIDGIADAIEINDQKFSYALFRGEPVKGGKVIVQFVTKTLDEALQEWRGA